MPFSDRLRTLRKLHGITQRQLAAAIGVSEITVQNYESQRKKPAYDALVSLSDYFDVSLDYLVGRSDDPTRH